MIKDDLLSLKSKLETIELEFDNRLKEVQEKQERYKKVDQMLEEYLKKGDCWIKLNIGGKIFETKLSTLIGTKDTVFYNLIALNLQNEGKVQKEIFIDRSYNHFHVIIDYLRNKKINLRSYDRIEKDDIIKELDFYGIEAFPKNMKNQIEIEWDQGLSKAGACTINTNDRRSLTVHTTGCYTHFVTNKVWTDESFLIEFESTVTQTDNYFYFGIINESYNYSSNCMCCNPAPSFFIKCDGSVHIGGGSVTTNLSWFSAPVTLGIKANLQEKKIYFYIQDKGEVGPYTINGNQFRVVSGHCNSGNGIIKITNCTYI